MLPSFTQRRLKEYWEHSRVGEHVGIVFADMSRATDAQDDFIGRTRSALDLIAQVDPRRFQRVQAHIKYIVHRELPSAYAMYPGKQFQACFVDFTRLHFERHPETMLWGYAAILVHEATHGAIERFGISSRRSNREQIEGLCDAEATRFLRRKNDRAAELWDEVMNRPGRRAALRARWRLLGLFTVWRRRHTAGQSTNLQGGANGRQSFSSKTNRASAAAASRRSP